MLLNRCLKHWKAVAACLLLELCCEMVSFKQLQLSSGELWHISNFSAQQEQ